MLTERTIRRQVKRLYDFVDPTTRDPNADSSPRIDGGVWWALAALEWACGIRPDAPMRVVDEVMEMECGP